MSTDESYGSHSLTSFVARLELTITKSPQLKQMAPRRRLSETAQNLPHELYKKLKIPPHETQADRKKRIHKITREWAKRWQLYESLDDHHEEMFVVNLPLKV